MTYIHQLTDWPVFEWAQDLLGDKLASVRHRQGRLLGRFESLGGSLPAQAQLRSLTDEAVRSSRIDGHALDEDQVRSALSNRLSPDSHGPNHGAGAGTGARAGAEDTEGAKGAAGVLLDSTEHFDEPLTEDRLYGWHRSLFPADKNDLAKKQVGCWRNDRSGPMRVMAGPKGRERIQFQAPSAKLIDGEIQSFLEWFNGDYELDGVLKAGVAHLWFVTIHPFTRGNGRIARTITDLTLARSENTSKRFYSLSAQMLEERDHYYGILEATQKGRLDITDWLVWFLDCLDRAFERAEASAADLLTKGKFWQVHAGKEFNERQIHILDSLLNETDRRITSSEWAKLGGCSQDTASRDINDLLGRGVLARGEAGGRSTGYFLGEV